MFDLVIKDIRLDGKPGRFDIAIEGGKIASITATGTNQATASNVIDGKGNLVLPPFIEPHIHLDSVLSAGEPRWNESGTLFDGIQIWSERKPSLTREDVKERALKAMKWQMAQGILHVRTHVDVTDPRLIALQALLEVKQEVAPFMSLQIVAFPQEGIYSYNRGQGAELLEEALKMGADVVGAIPHYEYTREYGVKSVDFCFEMAEKYNRLVDIHCDEIDDEQSRFVEVVATRALETGMKERVTASHTTAMGSYNGAYAYKLFGLLKKADMNFISNPLINITLQGRFDNYPKRRGLTRVKELWESGINVSLGHDDIMDPWYSLGTGSMVQVAHMAVHAAHMTGRQQVMATIDMITGNSARTLQIESAYGIAEGKPANFNLIPAEDKWDLIRRMPNCRYVISQGQVVAETPEVMSTVYWKGGAAGVGTGGAGAPDGAGVRGERIDFRR